MNYTRLYVKIQLRFTYSCKTTQSLCVWAACLTASLTDWLTNQPNDRPTYRQTDWRTDGQADRPTDTPQIDRSSDGLNENERATHSGLTDWRTDGMTDSWSLIDRRIDLLTNWLANWMANFWVCWLAGLLTNWLTDWLTGDVNLTDHSYRFYEKCNETSNVYPPSLNSDCEPQECYYGRRLYFNIASYRVYWENMLFCRSITSVLKCASKVTEKL